MVKKVEQKQEETQKVHKNSKYNRFDHAQEPDNNNKNTWPADAVVYIGHLPHGFYENQLKQYFTQYGEVLAVKVARSRKTARSKGYAFVQFKYPEVAQIVADTMQGYLLMSKVLTANTLPANAKNPFKYSSSHQYKFINWKRLFIKQKNREKTEQETHKQVSGLLRNEKERKQKLIQMGIRYEFPGFAGCLKAFTQ